ncbi:MAG TPA: tripartite tricarboxylate transporter substrate-binding protein, partial [Candidatus Glassbacteria bacterium]|nr:tripartite tricarboxylate transporter substrate-binding protein [Candidatus Glassbacteria bacterium]
IHIPTGGGGPALTMLLGGHVEISAFFPPVVKPHLAKGTLRALAVNSTERLGKELATIPTLREELGFSTPISWWFAVFAPRATPQPAVQKLRSALKNISEDAQFVKLMTKLGFEIKFMGGEEFEQVFKEQRASFSALLKSMR